jgi:sulfatase maturation enzyme AslB (radical SAM superfamily)
MSALTFFEKYMGRQQKKVETTLARYQDLVVSIATGHEPNPDDVEQLLASVGKSVNDLQQDVSRYQRRIELKAKSAALPKLERERRELDKKLAAADQALEAAEKLHDETIAPLYARRQEIDHAISESNRASSELIQTCDNTNLKHEVAKLHAQLNETVLQAKAVGDRARQLEREAEHARECAAREVVQSIAERHREHAAQLQKDSETARHEERKLAKRLVEFEKRCEQLENQMRDA